jgi:hypothetical protein
VLLALILADIFENYIQEKIPIAIDNNKGDKTFCLSISGLDK